MDDYSPPKRYFGMTLAQVGILAGLALLACLLLSALGYLIVRNVLGGASPPAVVPPAETATPTFTATFTPTITPTPTATPIPYESVLPAGWNPLRYASVELWLPPSFVGGDMLDNRSATLAAIAALGPEFSSVVEASGQIPPTTLLLAVDPNLGRYLIITNVIVFFEVGTPGGLDGYPNYYLENYYLAELPNSYIQDNRRYAIRDLPGRRFIISARRGTVEFSETVYILQDGDTIWALSCVTSAAELYERLPVFDQIAQTFRVAP
jgi:hypothetical protein